MSCFVTRLVPGVSLDYEYAGIDEKTATEIYEMLRGSTDHVQLFIHGVMRREWIPGNLVAPYFGGDC
jgi:hypothetical protein